MNTFQELNEMELNVVNGGDTQEATSTTYTSLTDLLIKESVLGANVVGRSACAESCSISVAVGLRNN